MFFLLLVLFFYMFLDFNSYVWNGRTIYSGVYFLLSGFFVCLTQTFSITVQVVLECWQHVLSIR